MLLVVTLMVVTLMVAGPWGLLALADRTMVSNQKYWLIADPVSMGSQAPDLIGVEVFGIETARCGPRFPWTLDDSAIVSFPTQNHSVPCDILNTASSAVFSSDVVSASWPLRYLGFLFLRFANASAKFWARASNSDLSGDRVPALRALSSACTAGCTFRPRLFIISGETVPPCIASATWVAIF
jgi:hypothetical protein